MKKIVICTFLFAAGAASLLSINSKIDFQSAKFNFKNSYAIVLGYDKSMGEKQLKLQLLIVISEKLLQMEKLLDGIRLHSL